MFTIQKILFICLLSYTLALPQDESPKQLTITTQRTNDVVESTTLNSVDNSTQQNDSEVQLMKIFSDVPEMKLFLGITFVVLASSLLNMVLYFLIPYIPCLRRAQFNPYWTQAREMTGVSLLPNH